MSLGFTELDARLSLDTLSVKLGGSRGFAPFVSKIVRLGKEQ
jgi:hypothetical protein